MADNEKASDKVIEPAITSNSSCDTNDNDVNTVENSRVEFTLDERSGQSESLESTAVPESENKDEENPSVNLESCSDKPDNAVNNNNKMMCHELTNASSTEEAHSNSLHNPTASLETNLESSLKDLTTSSEYSESKQENDSSEESLTNEESLVLSESAENNSCDRLADIEQPGDSSETQNVAQSGDVDSSVTTTFHSDQHASFSKLSDVTESGNNKVGLELEPQVQIGESSIDRASKVTDSSNSDPKGDSELNDAIGKDNKDIKSEMQDNVLESDNLTVVCNTTFDVTSSSVDFKSVTDELETNNIVACDEKSVDVSSNIDSAEQINVATIEVKDTSDVAATCDVPAVFDLTATSNMPAAIDLTADVPVVSDLKATNDVVTSSERLAGDLKAVSNVTAASSLTATNEETAVSSLTATNDVTAASDLLNTTQSSSEDLLDDSTFLPSESLLFTPDKMDISHSNESFDSLAVDLHGEDELTPAIHKNKSQTLDARPVQLSSLPDFIPSASTQNSSKSGSSSIFQNRSTNAGLGGGRPRIHSDNSAFSHDRLNYHSSSSAYARGSTNSLSNSGPSSAPPSRDNHAANTSSRRREDARGEEQRMQPANDRDSPPLSLPPGLVPASGSKSYDYLLKVLLVGDSDVGKQEIITGMEDGSLDSPYTTSTGAGAAYKTTIILIDGKKVKLHIWDTSGQGRFCTIIRSYSRGAQGILLVYDITNRWSFEGIDRWVREVEEHAPGIPKVLVGNRLHLAFKRQVDPLEAETYAQKHNMGFYEISPLVDFNITESFQELCRMALKRNGMERLWRGNRVLTLHEMCCHAIVARTNVYGINKLPLPDAVKANLKSYAMTRYPAVPHGHYHHQVHTLKAWKERKKKLRKEEKISNCVNATRKSCAIS